LFFSTNPCDDHTRNVEVLEICPNIKWLFDKISGKDFIEKISKQMVNLGIFTHRVLSKMSMIPAEDIDQLYL